MGEERHTGNLSNKATGQSSASSTHALTPNGASGFNVTVPSVSLPKGGGAIKSVDEQFNVNPVNGSANFSIPLPVGSARGFAPALSLSYSTGTGNGIFGLGWALSLASIKRKTDKELPQYLDAVDSDTYVISGSEDLVPAMQLVNDAWQMIEDDSPNGQYTVRRYRPRIETAFARIERWTKKDGGTIHWRVTSKENITTLFGDTPNCRIAHEQKIFEWLPRITWDDKGNCAVYEYKAEDGAGIDADQAHNKNRINGNAPFTNTLLKRVRCGNVVPYNNNDPVPAQFLFETVFDYGEHDAHNAPFNEIQPWPFRSDAFSSYQAGFEIRTCRLCRRVLLYHHVPELPGGSACVRSLDLTYDNNEQTGNFSFLKAITITGYTKHEDNESYTKKSLPPLSFSYQKHEWNTNVQTPAKEDLVHAPVGIFEPNYQWVDLYSEGLSGILSHQEAGLFYKHNLGNGKFSEGKLLSQQPSFWNGRSEFQLQELEANGTKYLTSFNGPVKGFFKIDDVNEWQPFDAFEQVPNRNFKDENTRMLDLNGDGKAELLITEDNVFVWYPSLGEKGYDHCRKVEQYFDEEKGPHIVFNNNEQSIFLADMNGDGLTDIVRIRNGSVCYWPNLGYGNFGAKVTMDNAPVFDHPDLFNASFIKLADIDGSGTTDIIYAANQQCTIWLNQHGNGFFTEQQRIDPFPDCHLLAQVAVMDFLGNGTSCIVWSSMQPKDNEHPLRYINLMNSKKPHLLIGYKNNMGKEVELAYQPSTFYYLQDKASGRPWVTKLPFPVHCLCKVITWDRIMKTRLASEYTYHHGYYDHAEREFRGFGRVDQQDAEEIDTGADDQALHQPPVLVKSWFHTGAFLDGTKILTQFTHEYAPNEIHPENLLTEPEIPVGLSMEELRQGIRACKGRLLRKEVYAMDGSALQTMPYSVEQNNCAIQLLQPQSQNKYACFITPESEQISYQYERDTADPRIAHRFILETDSFANVLKTAAVVYPRKAGDAAPEQVKQYGTYRENNFTNGIDTSNDHRVPVLYQTKLFELTGLSAPAGGYYTLQQIKDACAGASFIDYDAAPNGSLQKRLVDHSRLQFRENDGLAVLPFGSMASKALLHQTFKAAFNQSQLTAIFNNKVSPAILTGQGGYVLADNYYWIPSAKPQYDAAHFFLPIAYTDAFNNVSQLEYDSAYHLFIRKTTDALGNEMLVDHFNYRVLQPYVMQDANDNVSAVRFDELGMVVRHFMIGKKGIDAGDEFDGASVEVSANDVPAVTIDYHVSEWYDQSTQPGFDIDNYKPKPAFFITTARETHYHANTFSETQQSFSYFNGSGKIIVKKVQAEPGEALQVNADGTVTTVNTAPAVRWVGNGRSILNNKGNVVKQYEPYFSVTPAYDDEKEMAETGVTSIMHYDALSRLIQTDLPNKTFTKVEFTPWMQKTFDANDTVAASDWYTFRITTPDPALATPEEISAANKAFQHNNTPSMAHLDTLGRVFLQEADTGTEKIATHTQLDIEGKPLVIKDGLNRPVIRYNYDLLSRSLQQNSMDAGLRYVLPDINSQPLLQWDKRDHEFEFSYDELRRVKHSTVKTGAGAAVMYSRSVYGEALPLAAAKAGNLRGMAYKSFDQCGIITMLQNDFKGNQLSSTRQLTAAYKNTIDWTNEAAVSMEADVYTTATEYDALNRVVKMITPHTPAMLPSEIIPRYNEAAVLNTVDLRIRGAATLTTVVTNIDYNAKAQREAIFYGNGTKTKYTYDPLTFRLTNLLTTRNNGNILQNIDYTYDPVGNITRIKDNAQADVFFDNEQVQALNEYEYDAIYRLINASGRKHAGQTDVQPKSNVSSNSQLHNHPFINGGGINPNDAQAFRNYTEAYEYDKAGNMLEQQHVSKDSSWTRSFEYDNNRLTRTSVAGDDYDYTYDAHGNMYGLETVNNELWNFNDQFKQAGLTGGGTVYYVYDTKGERVRKIVERQNGVVQERIYLGAIEIYRERNSAGTVTLERETLQVLDNQQRLALVDTPVIKPAGSTELELIRYQYANHIGSSCIELDGAAQVISYEEYFPYGTTSYTTIDSTREVAPKRYRYTSKERDEESGLSYHGARYYAPWLCRWTKCDPIGIADGLNQYQFVYQNPIKGRDVSGKDVDITVDEKKHTITYSTTVHVYAKEADKAKVEKAAQGAEKFYKDQSASKNATVKDEKGQPWKVQFDVKYKVYTDHGIPARIKTDMVGDPGKERRKDSLEITNAGDYKRDKIKPGDNFMEIKEKGGSRGLGGKIEPEYDQTPQTNHSLQHLRMGELYLKKDVEVAVPGGSNIIEMEYTDTELKNNLIHETGHQLGFDERYQPDAKGTPAHDGYENDFMSNVSRFENKEIFKHHFEDAAKMALGVSLGESSTFIFRGEVDDTRSGRLQTGKGDYDQFQIEERGREIEYHSHFLLLNPY